MKYRIWDKINENYNEYGLFVVGVGAICFIEDNELVAVDRNNYIVELSTGLFDKNGKEIYEGDIITDIEYNGYIGWYKRENCWAVMELDEYGICPQLFECQVASQFEVVGNVHNEQT